MGKKKKEKRDNTGKTRWMMTRNREYLGTHPPAPHHLADVSHALSIDFESGACGDGDGWKVDGGLSASHLTTKYSLTHVVFGFWVLAAGSLRRRLAENVLSLFLDLCALPLSDDFDL